jgi:hypothetical protein
MASKRKSNARAKKKSTSGKTPSGGTKPAAKKAGGMKPAAKKLAIKKAAFSKGAMKRILGVGFETWLIDRGPNVHAVNELERASGGNPARPTPYRVARFSSSLPANRLSSAFAALGATAEVRSS